MPPPSTPPHKVAIIGYGLSAKIFHLPFILSLPHLFTLSAIVQRHPTKSNNAAHNHPSTKIYKDTQSLLSDPTTFQLVVVTTPPDTHFALASMFLKAGKHVLLGKPMTPTSAEARELIRIANENDVFLSVYQNRRYDTDFLTLKSILANGELGRVTEFESHFDRHRPEPPEAVSWKQDSSVYSAVFDLGTHLIDQVVDLYGLPAGVTGFVGSQRSSCWARKEKGTNEGEELEDSFTAILHYGHAGIFNDCGRMVATCKASVVSAETSQLRYWVRGTKGSHKKFHLDPQEDQLKGGVLPGDETYGVETESHHGGVTNVGESGKVEERKVVPQRHRGYGAFYQELAEALRSGDERDLPVNATVAADVIKICEMVRESSREGRTLKINMEDMSSTRRWGFVERVDETGGVATEMLQYALV